MSEDSNPNRLPGAPDDALAQTLEELIAGRSTRRVPRVPVGTADRTGASPASTSAAACPEPYQWLRLTGGETSGAAADALLAHAVTCIGCAARLRMSLRPLAEEASPVEAAELAGLASSSPQWQRRLAGELARTAHRPIRTFRSKLFLWAGAALAASLVLAAALTLWWQHANAPERLLAEAYGHSRIFPLRLPGAAYAEVSPETHLRGGSTGRESAKLLEARARIESHLETAPQDPHWLQLEARAEVLEEQFDPAIDILDRLVAAGPVTAALLTDDAAAYFQRGAANGSENDRATALDYLRRADELAPGDPVVLFNEAIAMEDRGQVMNAVETWNRYLRFERDPQWLAEGRRRLQTLELKLNQLKTHQSRMEQHLATPQAMRALAADPATLAGLDEEFSSTLLPELLRAAFPAPVDRSRGSPCVDACQAARTLLHALAASLERNHQDPWLTRFLPSDYSPSDQRFTQAAQALAEAIHEDVLGDFPAALHSAQDARQLFHILGNAAGEDRAQVEQAYALQRSFHLASCHRVAQTLLQQHPEFAWIQIQATIQDGICNTGPGTATEDIPAFQRATSQAQDRRYALLELRARNMHAGAALESGDTEYAWQIDLATVRKFYSGDYPALRLSIPLTGLSMAEESTPRVQNALLLEREAMAALELTQSPQVIAAKRFEVAAAAIRAGSAEEAQEQMRRAQAELAAAGGGKSIYGFLAENEMAMASLYLGRRDLARASSMLDAARGHLAGDDDSLHRRAFAAASGELDLALGRAKTAESMLRDAILDEERQGSNVGAKNVVFALRNRDIYAVLAGIWLAQGRSGEDILALWERYRLRALGEPVPACPNRGLACLKPKLIEALGRLGQDRLMGQVVLLDRVLLYRASGQGVVWTSVPIGRQDLLAAASPLEQAVSSPATSQDSVDQSARRGSLLFGALPPSLSGQLLLEPDPLLGNLPWPAVETANGPLGLHFDLEETPSLLLPHRPNELAHSGHPLVVGASIASGEDAPLPEVLREAREVAHFVPNPRLLLAAEATEAQVAAHLGTAPAIHFAGHARRQAGATRLLLASTSGIRTGTGSPETQAESSYLDSSLLRAHPPRAARLVVFSACSTGKREEGWNHGMGDIVDTLASLGVPEVVATRWQIDSASAVPMMDAFYGGLSQGLSVSQALTAARLSLIRDARYRHPYYWAAYYASGTGKTDLSEVFNGNTR